MDRNGYSYIYQAKARCMKGEICDSVSHWEGCMGAWKHYAKVPSLRFT